MFRLFLAASLLLPTAAVAQDGPPPDSQGGNSVIVGLGIAYGPDYEGSNDGRFIPGGIIRAQLGNIRIENRGLKLYTGFALAKDGPLEVEAGPIISIRPARTGSVDDALVDQLPDRDLAVEVGAFVGIAYKGLTSPFDRLSLRLDGLHDVAGGHGDWILSPEISFTTPVTRTTLIGLSANLEFVGDDFATTYFGVTSAESTMVPALAAYQLDGGLKSWGAGLLIGQSLGRNPRKGWSLFGLANYKRLVGEFANSPLVAQRGDADQWFFVGGVGYSF